MNESNSPARHRRSHSYLLVLITVILTGWALKATGTFMIPVVFSVILALLVAPLDRWVADRVPDKVGWLGRLAAMGTILVVLLGFAGLMWIAAEQTIERFPNPTESVPGHGYKTARCAGHAAILTPVAASGSRAFCSALI
jgi:AI-2 transport protein TqsA